MAVTEDTILPRVKGLSVLEGEYENYYYTNRNMLNNGVFIELMDVEQDSEEFEVDTFISVSVVNDIDACSYQVHSIGYLEAIQSYRIIKDVLELYEDNSLGDFIHLIKCMSSQRQSASMQTEKKHKDEIMFNAHKELDLVKTLLEQESE